MWVMHRPPIMAVYFQMFFVYLKILNWGKWILVFFIGLCSVKSKSILCHLSRFGTSIMLHGTCHVKIDDSVKPSTHTRYRILSA